MLLDYVPTTLKYVLRHSPSRAQTAVPSWYHLRLLPSECIAQSSPFARIDLSISTLAEQSSSLCACINIRRAMHSVQRRHSLPYRPEVHSSPLPARRRPHVAPDDIPTSPKRVLAQLEQVLETLYQYPQNLEYQPVWQSTYCVGSPRRSSSDNIGSVD